MKRIKGVLVALCACVVCLLLLTACSTKLTAPAGFRLDEATLVLHWNKVNSASAYVIEIAEGISYTTRENHYSLESLAPGEYVIKIRAISYSKDLEESDLAEYAFKREQESGLQYELSDTRDSYVLVGIGNATGNVVMDDYYRGKPVTAIDKAALRRCNELTGFVVGKHVTTIGENAFYACAELTSVTLPAGLKSIGEGAFQSCTKLESITLPEGVTTLAPYTFSMCKGLREVSIGAGVTSVGMYAFSDCFALESISLPDTIEHLDEYAFSGCKALNQVIFSENLKAIGQYAFYGCTALTQLSFNDSLEEIGQGAFSESGITNLVMPEKLSVIGNAAFSKCASLEQVQLNENLTKIGFDVFLETPIMSNCTEEVLIIGDWVIAAMKIKTSEETKVYEVPANVVGIADGAFAFCDKLQRVKMENVKYIGEMSFVYCESLWQVLCGESLLQIGRYAFMQCVQLTDVFLGNCVERIQDYAFLSCERLEDAGITLPKTLKEMGCGAFNGTRLYFAASNGLVYVDDWLVGAVSSGYFTGAYLQEGTRGICNYAFQYAFFLDGQLYLPNSIEIIGKGAFYKNETLLSLNFPAKLKYIGDYAFANTVIEFDNDGLTVIPEGCEYLGDYAFRYCKGITTLSVPGTIKHIGDYAFMGCSQLGVLRTEEGLDTTVVLLDATVTLEEGIESIGVRAFYGCEALRSIALPDSLKELGEYAFYKCSSLENIDFGTGLKEIKGYTFGNCTTLKEIRIPGSIHTIGKHAFRGCTAAEKIVLHEGVEMVGEYAFAYGEEVMYLSIADSVTHIGNFAFRGMPKLKAIHLSDTLSYVGRLAFYGSHDATIYLEGIFAPETWDERWNAAYRPVVLDVDLSQENDCVASWTAIENGLLNLSGYTKLSAPSKEGFVFAGWSTSQNSSDWQFAALTDVPVGTTVYPVWSEYVEETPETPDQPETPDNNEN